MGGVFGTKTSATEGPGSGTSQSTGASNYQQQGLTTTGGTFPWSTQQQGVMNSVAGQAGQLGKPIYSGGTSTYSPMEDWLGSAISRNAGQAEQGYKQLQGQGVGEQFGAYSNDAWNQAKKGADTMRGEFAQQGGLRGSPYQNSLTNYYGDVAKSIASKRAEMELQNRGIQLGATQGLAGLPGQVTPSVGYLQGVKSGDIERAMQLGSTQRAADTGLAGTLTSYLGTTRPPETGTTSSLTSGTSNTSDAGSTWSSGGSQVQTSRPSFFGK